MPVCGFYVLCDELWLYMCCAMLICTYYCLLCNLCIDNHSILIGNVACMHTHSITIRHKHQAKITALEAEGKTVVCVSVDSSLCGIIALQDKVRPEAQTVVHHIQTKLGLRVCILSGD